MSWAWSIPIQSAPSLVLASSPLTVLRLRVVVPTFRDWDDLRLTIDSVMECRPRPQEIVIVNDNHESDLPAWVGRYPVQVVNYVGNRGPSYARNAGASLATRYPIDWLYFTDTGCTRDPSFFAVLADASIRLPRSSVAVAGPVRGTGSASIATPINHFMTEESILNPPFDAHGPQAIVTANAAVSMSAFRLARGFDTTYPFAAGEDLDLGIRLRRLGSIGWAAGAAVHHRFTESVDDFEKRFFRYGAGNAHLEHRLRLPSLRLTSITAQSPKRQWLADLQVAAMQRGYEQHCSVLIEREARRHRGNMMLTRHAHGR